MQESSDKEEFYELRIRDAQREEDRGIEDTTNRNWQGWLEINCLGLGDFDNRTVRANCAGKPNQFGGKILEQLIADYQDQLLDLEEQTKLIANKKRRLRERLKNLEELHSITNNLN